jgi:Kef-type K+ transport system membrane component KefB
MIIDLHHIAESIEFQMSLLLFTALAGYQLASWLRLPSVVGAVILGLVVGPSFLNLITYGEFVESIAHIGAIILLFIVGLEVNLKTLAKARYAVIALLGVVVPWVGGYYVSIAFELSTTKAIVVGIALTATSIALTAETLREAGIIKSDLAQAIIASAILDDVLALLAVGMLGSGGTLELDPMIVLVKLVIAAAFLAVGAWLGRTWVSKLIVMVDRTPQAERLPEISFVFAMMMAFAYALLAELAGLSAIVGAFVAGLALEGVQLRKAHHVEEGANYLRAIFSAVFFVSLGVLADFSTLELSDLWFALTVLVVAILTKVVGCGFPAVFFGFKAREAMILGLGMAPRGEVAMVVALLALTTGAIEQTVFLAIVIVAIGTSILVPPMLRSLIAANEAD